MIKNYTSTMIPRMIANNPVIPKESLSVSVVSGVMVKVGVGGAVVGSGVTIAGGLAVLPAL